MGYHELPIELWIRILDELPKECRSQLYPVNRTFMHILFSKKYRRVRVGDFLARHKENRILKYIKHISQPHITQHVRHVTIVLAPDVVLAHCTAAPHQAITQLVTRAAMKYPGWGGIGYPVKKIAQAVAEFLAQASKVDSLSIGGWQNASDEPLSGFVDFIWKCFASRLRELELIGYHTAISEVLSSPFPSLPQLEILSLNFHATSILSSTSLSARKKALSKPVIGFLNHTSPTLRELSIHSTTGSSFSSNLVLPQLESAPNLTTLSLNIIGEDDDPADFDVIQNFVTRSSTKLVNLEFPPQEWLKHHPPTSEDPIPQDASPIRLTSLKILSTYADTPASSSLQNIQAFSIPSRYTLTTLSLQNGFLYLSELQDILNVFDPECNALRSLQAKLATVTPDHLEYLGKRLMNLVALDLQPICLLHDANLEKTCVGRSDSGIVPETGVTTPRMFLNRLGTFPQSKLCFLRIDRMYRTPLPKNMMMSLRNSIPSLKEATIV